MLLRIDPGESAPLHEQLAAALRAAIAAGEVAPGERLPSARELARDLDVNMHTVLRAYATLRDEGLLDLRRGRGAVVRRDGSTDRAQLEQLAAALAAEARRQGVAAQELHALVDRRLSS
jgi:GntR family transcriptional regulator